MVIVTPLTLPSVVLEFEVRVAIFTSPARTKRPKAVLKALSPKVKLAPAPVMVPLIFNKSAAIVVPNDVVPAPSVMLPFHDEVPTPTSAPPELMPVPMSDNDRFVGVRLTLFNLNSAPLFTVTPEVFKVPLPSALLLLNVSEPPVTVVAPVKVLVPDNVNVPVPPLVKLPLVPLILPLKVLLVLPLVINVPLPKVTLPAPINPPIVSVLLFKASVALANIVTSVDGKTFEPVKLKIPALILVTPS